MVTQRPAPDAAPGLTDVFSLDSLVVEEVPADGHAKVHARVRDQVADVVCMQVRGEATGRAAGLHHVARVFEQVGGAHHVTGHRIHDAVNISAPAEEERHVRRPVVKYDWRLLQQRRENGSSGNRFPFRQPAKGGGTQWGSREANFP